MGGKDTKIARVCFRLLLLFCCMGRLWNFIQLEWKSNLKQALSNEYSNKIRGLVNIDTNIFSALRKETTAFD